MTTLEALASNELSNFPVYNTISAATTPHHYPNPSHTLFSYGAAAAGGGDVLSSTAGFVSAMLLGDSMAPTAASSSTTTTVQGRKKRRRRARSCKNMETERQRMTHIAVERNRRRQMNAYLAVLRSLMPESYVQRGDQASIVGGTIDFVKELEQLLQSLEAQKRTLQQQQQQQSREYCGGVVQHNNSNTTGWRCGGGSGNDADLHQPPFAQFFAYPQYTRCHRRPREYSSSSSEMNHRSTAVVVGAVADIEVTLIETHANLRILSPKRPGQLLKMAAGFQSLQLTILHLSVTTLDPMVLYSFSAKVEEGCNLTSVDDIAAAVHHMLSLIEADVFLI